MIRLNGINLSAHRFSKMKLKINRAIDEFYGTETIFK